jgi:hypothetical protein
MRALVAMKVTTEALLDGPGWLLAAVVGVGGCWNNQLLAARLGLRRSAVASLARRPVRMPGTAGLIRCRQPRCSPSWADGKASGIAQSRPGQPAAMAPGRRGRAAGPAVIESQEHPAAVDAVGGPL